MASSYPKAGSASRLKVARLPTAQPPRLRLGGILPPEHMPAAEYKVHFDGASKEIWKRGFRIELKFRVLDGEFTGVALSEWITVDGSGVISPRSRYAQQCEIALGRPLAAEDDLNDPASIFSSASAYRASVGFRKTDKARGGIVNAENAKNRKDEKDGLRVHELLSREDL